MYERLTLTVGQLNLYIKDLFNRDTVLGCVRIKGEISNLKKHTSGHIYMSLKDESGVLRAVMFRSAASGLDFKPENGMKVLADGRVAVYERDGQYQLYIDSLKPDGLGDLHAAFERLKAKLGAEGLFDAVNKKPLPRFPKRVGVVTAPTGAAVRDIINILSRRFPYAEVRLYPVLVQGENAAASIVEAIEYFNKQSAADVLIVGRGGGSIEDLWAFNEEIVARAIFASVIPVISAVGHETDFTIADFVADLRAPTPSAAAELAVPSQKELTEKFNNVYGVLRTNVRRILENRHLVLKRYAESQALTNPKQRINENRMYVDHLCRMLENAVNVSVGEQKRRLGMAVSKLDALSPLGTISRGYSVAKTGDGAVIRSIAQVKSCDDITLTVNDGEIEAVVKQSVVKGF